MTSWDQYLDSLFTHGQSHLDKACIIGLDGSKWTSDNHVNSLKVAPAEASEIAKCFKTKDFSSFQANGVHVEGEKYHFLKVDDNVVLAKKKDKGAITCQSSQTGIIIAHTKEGCQQGYTNKAVANITGYLSSIGY